MILLLITVDLIVINLFFFARMCLERKSEETIGPRLLGRKGTIKNAYQMAGQLTIENHGLLVPDSLRLRVTGGGALPLPPRARANPRAG